MLGNRPAAVNAPLLARAQRADLAAPQRARRTNDPLATLSLNTARGRRIGDLVRAYLQALGSPTEVERQAAVIAAAELQVIAEEARAAALWGISSGAPSLDQVVRVQGIADRAVRSLGLPVSKPAIPDHPWVLSLVPPPERREHSAEGSRVSTSSTRKRDWAAIKRRQRAKAKAAAAAAAAPAEATP